MIPRLDTIICKVDIIILSGGSFINADDIIGQTGEVLGHNLFAYCKNNPVNKSDKRGFRSIYTVGEN